jgi:paraquat-inducible protein B
MQHEFKEAVWQEKKKGISGVWIVPILALVIGAWLVWSSYIKQGPTIHITFKSAAGIQAGKTVIKYKDIVVGKVTNVRFNEDLSNVIVTAQLQKNMTKFLSENSRFWVVQAKLGLGEVQGLDTLLSGVYIVMDPQKGNQEIRDFKGLDQIPVVSAGDKGKTFILKSNTIGSLEIGSPIYYKKLKAGSVASYKLDNDGQNITIEVFVKAPFDKLVTEKTKFYNASGINMSLNANGIEVDTESLVSIMMGGLAFDNFESDSNATKAPKGYVFKLYDNKKEAMQPSYKRELYFWVYFDESIRGLSIGAPVEFRGVKIGEVVNLALIGDSDTAEFKIPILIKIQPERFIITGNNQAKGNDINLDVFKKLLKKGFRAQLQSGNLLTGELFVSLDMYKDVAYIEPKKENGYYVIPTIPATMQTLKSDIQTLLDRVSKIPFEKIGKDIEVLLDGIHKNTMPKVNVSVDNLNNLINSTDKMMNSARKTYLDNNAQINKKILRLIDEMTRTTKSIKHLSDYLERHPESLIKGK